VQALREHGLSAAQIGTHAGAADTSLMLAVDPRLVRADRLAAPPVPGDGVAGDPRPSSAALGQLGVDLIVARSVAAIRRAVTR
jgi:creatinine amidohydrolase/Fe(II)-dependent formamide hydrolase-like protein